MMSFNPPQKRAQRIRKEMKLEQVDNGFLISRLYMPDSNDPSKDQVEFLVSLTLEDLVTKVIEFYERTESSEEASINEESQTPVV